MSTPHDHLIAIRRHPSYRTAIWVARVGLPLSIVIVLIVVFDVGRVPAPVATVVWLVYLALVAVEAICFHRAGVPLGWTPRSREQLSQLPIRRAIYRDVFWLGRAKRPDLP
jgi:hypothetical protein